MSAVSQANFLAKTSITDSDKRNQITSSLLTSDLYQNLNKQSFDWIYVDGPLGGYNSETDFQIEDNRGEWRQFQPQYFHLSTIKTPPNGL